MKNFLLLLILLLSFTTVNAQTFDIQLLGDGTVNNGAHGVILVQAKVTSGSVTTANNITDITFTICGPSGATYTVSTTATNPYLIKIGGIAGSNATFIADPAPYASPANWGSGWVTIATINVPVTGTYTLCAPLNIGIDLTDIVPTVAGVALLPLSLTTFQAAPLPTAIALDWGSTNELNFSGFEVERGMDGKSFEKIAWVAAKGGVSVAEYKHLDQTAQRGMTYYYRLKMVDNDGIFKYSPVRTARLGEGTINAFPNPSGGQYTIALERTRSAEGTVTVTDVMGKTVKMERRTLDAALTLDLNALPDGVYNVKIDDGTAAQTVRVVKQ